MSPILLTIYVLMWPVIVAGVLAVLVRGFAKEAAEARRDGVPII
ncbi:MAG TPA: putative transporter small subunit [Candidatus Dietzia intestinigallinarum]|nr:putative transporter small subunit [Candidatus Dietzia intestinigallinarum]